MADDGDETARLSPRRRSSISIEPEFPRSAAPPPRSKRWYLRSKTASMSIRCCPNPTSNPKTRMHCLVWSVRPCSERLKVLVPASHNFIGLMLLTSDLGFVAYRLVVGVVVGPTWSCSPLFPCPAPTIGGTMSSYVVAGARTPIGKLSGSLRVDVSAAELGGKAISAALDRAGVSPRSSRLRLHGACAAGGSGADHGPTGSGQRRHSDVGGVDHHQQGLPFRSQLDSSCRSC